jgi:hypothetical protein
MSVVGEFPGKTVFRRRAVRGPVNPMDKTTIVSIYPSEIIETKPTISPGIFIIPPGSFDNPSILIVGTSSWWREIDEEQPLLEIPVSSVQIADSIVKDYCNGILGCNMNDAMPGLFYVPGSFTLVDIRKSYKHELDMALVKQRNWFTALVKLADALWARSNGNPLAISDSMRMAAKELNIQKDWMKDFRMMDTVRCKACGALLNPMYPVCPTCHAINDPVKAKELGLTFAQ